MEWDVEAQAGVQFGGDDGWTVEGWERGPAYFLHVRACKADSAHSLSRAPHFSETTSVL